MKIVITEQQYGFLVNEDFSKTLDKDEKIKEIIDYIDQFDSLKDFRESRKHNGIRDYINTYFKNDPDYNWEKITEPLREKEKERKLKEYIDYINQFEIFSEFNSSPKYRVIKSFIDKNYDDDPYYNWKVITSNLKKGVRRDPNPDRLEITPKDLSGSIKRIIDYISQFKTMTEFRTSPEYMRINAFINKNFRDDERYNWNKITSDLEKKNQGPGSKGSEFDAIKDKEGSIKRIVDYVSKFDTLEEFKKDSMYRQIFSFINNNFSNDADYNWKKITSHMVKGVDKEKRIKEIIDYISQFNNYSDLYKSPKYQAYKNFVRMHYRDDPDYNWEKLTGYLRNKKRNTKLDEIIDYINKFKSLNAFRNSFAYDTIKNYINLNYKDHPEYNWKKIIEPLKK
jgi:Asp-tRNA(Asn)/Glu-tRNA(Gln) amidotransferase C subunit